MHLLLYEYCCVHADPAGLALLHEGWGMLRALVEDLSRTGTYHLTVLASPSLERRLKTFPGVDVVPTQPENDLEMLAHWAPKVDACLVIAPEFRGLLVERVETVGKAGGRSLNCSREFIRLTSDKLALARHCDAVGIPLPPGTSWSGELEWADFPAVLKPVDGAGSQATFLVRDESELHQAARRALLAGWPNLMVQRYVTGVAASVCLLAGWDLEVLPPTEQILSHDGNLRYQGARFLMLPDELLARAARLADRLDDERFIGMQGWVGMDLVLGTTPDKDCLIEINPRLTTSYLALRQRCRGNLAHSLVQAALPHTYPWLEWDWTPLEFRLE
jgi:predicted ATP-grasp superfamily ATP-dependent carboligase